MQTYCCRPRPSSTGTSFMARPQRGHGFRTWKTVFIGLPLLGGSLVGFDRRAQADCEKLALWGGAGVKQPTYCHMLGTPLSALRPIRLRSSTDLSPVLAASRSLAATCARAPLSYRDTFSQTSSRTARSSAVIWLSNIGIPPSAGTERTYVGAIVPAFTQVKRRRKFRDLTRARRLY